MAFINKDFMLQNDTAKFLFHNYAKSLPIFDFHTHLDARLIAENHQFSDIAEMWLAGDHYKWRAMRANGIPEEKITGNASPEEKFKAWAQTIEHCLGNPLYHWTHLELKMYFGIDELLGEDNWKEIYDRANEVIKKEKLTTKKLIESSNVEVICTTDSPLDSLEYHDKIREDKDFKVKILPSFRPDEAFNIREKKFLEFVNALGNLTNISIKNYSDFVKGLETRVEYFDERGAFISDHALEVVFYREATEEEIETIFQKALNGEEISNEEQEKFVTRLLIDLGEIYHKKNWVMQIHFGAIRDNNTVMYKLLGKDSGFDAIADQKGLARALNGLLDAMYQNNALPKMILYNLNPEYNHTLASAIGNFQGNDKGIKSKLQFGAGWWFNDTELGMLRQMTTLADHGLLMNFVGMLTDSRSFLSFSRHDYFRRILCNYVGEQVEQGKFPDDKKLLKKFIENISYYNAVNYFKKD